jgi:hypothetical protein
MGLAPLTCEAQRLLVHVRDGQHLARGPVLHHAWNESVLVEADGGTLGVHRGQFRLGPDRR